MTADAMHAELQRLLYESLEREEIPVERDPATGKLRRAREAKHKLRDEDCRELYSEREENT